MTKMKIVWVLLVGLTYLGASNLEAQINECKNGNVQSCYTAGLALTTGENGEDQEKRELGLEYIRKACKFSVEKACDTMGDNYYKDAHYQAAKPYLEKSCDRGIVDACEAMGTMYRDGQEVRQDDVRSRFFYKKACELGSKDACINIAIMYRGGFGVAKDRAKEKMYYKKACDAGSEVGCNSYTKLDNRDKGIEEPGLFERFLNLFK